MLELKTPREVAAMAVTGTFIAELLDDLEHRAEPGVNLLDLEHRARQLIAQRGATSCYWDYAPSFGRGPFRNVICLSVNDAVLHGLPHDYVLRDGDVLSMDIAVSIDGWVADSARSVIVGTPTRGGPRSSRHRGGPEAGDRRRAARQPPGRHLCGDRRGRRRVRLPGQHRVRWSRARAHHARGSARLQHRTCGTGTHTAAGADPRPRTLVRPHGTDKIVYDPDGWTIRSADGSRTSHSEHTIAITDGAPLVLTRREQVAATAL